jgi:hypothetical protein
MSNYIQIFHGRFTQTEIDNDVAKLREKLMEEGGYNEEREGTKKTP